MSTYNNGLMLKRQIYFPISKIFLIFIFMAGLNVMTRYYVWLAVAFVLFVVFNRVRFKLNVEFVSLFCLAVCMIVFDMSSLGHATTIIKILFYPLSYLMGSSYVSRANTGEEKEKRLATLIKLLAWGCFLHYLLNFLSTGNLSTVRNTVDFWTKSVLSATGQAALSFLMIALSIATIVSHKPLRQKLVSIVVLVVIMAYNLVLAGRAIFVVIILATFVAVGYYFFQSKQKKKLRVLILLFIIIAVFYLIYVNNLWDVRTIIEQSNFYKRFFGDFGSDITSDTRFQYKLEYLKNFDRQLFGGGQLFEYVGKYAHDIFLDTYDQAGIFALISIIVYMISGFVSLIRFLRRKTVSFELKQLILCVYLVLYFLFVSEPVLIGMPMQFVAYCIFSGAIKSITETEA